MSAGRFAVMLTCRRRLVVAVLISAGIRGLPLVNGMGAGEHTADREALRVDCHKDGKE